jgi:methionine-rich copper-binding protein CopC
MKTLSQRLAASAMALMITLGVTAQASAHAKLIKSDPPENGQPSDKKNFELTFSEAISGKLSAAEVTEAAGKKIPSTSMIDQNNKGLMVMLNAPLTPGDYTIAWHAVASDDGHRTAGVVPFNVK